MEENMLKTSFSYTDEFGQKTTVDKTFTQNTLEIMSALELLVDEFKRFMSASGFSRNLIDTIQIVED